jgi:hypothetical protein
MSEGVPDMHNPVVPQDVQNPMPEVTDMPKPAICPRVMFPEVPDLQNCEWPDVPQVPGMPDLKPAICSPLYWLCEGAKVETLIGEFAASPAKKAKTEQTESYHLADLNVEQTGIGSMQSVVAAEESCYLSEQPQPKLDSTDVHESLSEEPQPEMYSTNGPESDYLLKENNMEPKMDSIDLNPKMDAVDGHVSESETEL